MYTARTANLDTSKFDSLKSDEINAETAAMVEAMQTAYDAENQTIDSQILVQTGNFAPIEVEEDEDEQMAIRPQILVRNEEPAQTAPSSEKMVFNVNLGGGAQQTAPQTTPDTPENRKKYITIAVIALVLIILALLAFKFLKK